MNKTRYVAGTIVSALVALPLIGVDPAHAATFEVTYPVDVSNADAVLYTGSTETIEWTVDTETGAYTLELWSTTGTPAKIATIGTGTDITAGTFDWTIPTSITALVAEDVAIKVVPASGSAVSSDVFDLRKAAISNAEIVDVGDDTALTDVVSGGEYEVIWDTDGEAGDTVKVDLVRTVGGKAKASPLVASTANDGSVEVTIPAKAVADTGAGTYTVKVTPSNPAAAADSSAAAFTVTAPALTLTSQGSDGSVALGQPVTVTWSYTTPSGVTKLEAKPATGKNILIAAEANSGYDWYPTTTGVYNIVATAKENKKLTVTSVGKVTVTASTEVVVQEDLADITVVNGQPIDISWGFYDDGSDTTPNETILPIDINLVGADGKSVSVAKGVLGADAGSDLRSYEWIPSGKVKAGAYTIKLSRTGGTTTSDKTVTFAEPTTLTVTDLAASWEAGSKVTVAWSITDSAELPVEISLVPASGKTVSLAKKVTGTSKVVTIPAGTAAGTYDIKVATADKFGVSKAVLSDLESIAVTAPVVTVTVDDFTTTNGSQIEVTWAYGDDSQAPVKLELFKGSATKPSAVISKSAPTDFAGAGGIVWTVPGALAAGTDYVVRATVLGFKASAPTDDSASITVAAPVVTVQDVTGPVVVGQSVELTWSTVNNEAQSVTVSLVKGTKVIAKLDSKAVTVHGDGSYTWIVGSKLVAGTDYKIQVTDNAIKTVTDDSATFEVKLNSTTVAAG